MTLYNRGMIDHSLRVTGPSEDLTTRIVDGIKSTLLQVERVAFIYNLDANIVRKWLKAGHQVVEEEREPTTPYEINCVEFYLRISRAEAEAEAGLIQSMSNAATEDWRAAQAVLQARFSRDWAPRQSLKIEDLSKVDPTKMTNEELDKFIEDRMRK